jgi:hypothetical protein
MPKKQKPHRKPHILGNALFALYNPDRTIDNINQIHATIFQTTNPAMPKGHFKKIRGFCVRRSGGNIS